MASDPTQPTQDLEPIRVKARLWRGQHADHVGRLTKSDGNAYPPSGSDAHRPELWKAEHWRWLKLHDNRPEGFVEERRKHCITPHLCFEFGDAEPFCGPCDAAAMRALS